jgi:hypothetical protein
VQIRFYQSSMLFVFSKVAPVTSASAPGCPA